MPLSNHNIISVVKTLIEECDTNYIFGEDAGEAKALEEAKAMVEQLHQETKPDFGVSYENVGIIRRIMGDDEPIFTPNRKHDIRWIKEFRSKANCGLKQAVDAFRFLERERKFEIQKTLVVSTSHISQEEAEGLVRKGLEIEQSQYCFILYANNLLGGNIEEYDVDILALMELARELGCSYLKLDRDGPVLDGFKVYGW